MNDIDDVLTAMRGLSLTGGNLERLITGVWAFARDCNSFADTAEVQDELLDAGMAAERLQTWPTLIEREQA